MTHSGEAWFITRGVNTGIDKLVGKVIREQRIEAKDRALNYCFGVVPWGCMFGRQNLSSQSVSTVR